MICRREAECERDRVLDIVEAVYGRRPPPEAFPDDRLVVEDNGKIAAFAALYRLDGVSMGSVDWLAVEASRSETDLVAILGILLDGLRELRTAHRLRAVMIHSPYDAIRGHLGAADLKPGEENLRRLAVTAGPGGDRAGSRLPENGVRRKPYALSREEIART